MIVGVADTHSAIWYLFDDARLSIPARHFIDEAERARNKICVSAISMVEIVYLVEKGRLPAAAYNEMAECLADPLHVFVEAAMTSATAASMRRVPRDRVPDMPDRIVAATALYHDVPVITRDRRILTANLETVW